nr:Chain A, Microtubule-associated protein tau [Homo sapiens]
KVQIINKKL